MTSVTQSISADSAINSTWTIQKILDWSVAYLKDKGSPSARVDCEILLAHVLNCERIRLYVDYRKPLTQDERQEFKTCLRRRAMGEPVAYIVGKQGFWKDEFVVTRDVLIPRPETEHLVEAVLQYFPQKQEAYRFLDIGTGSGCLALSLAREYEHATIVACDIDSKALGVAQKNVERLKRNKQVECLKADALQIKLWSQMDPVDAIISNPPYVAPSDWDTLPMSVRGFEPSLALLADQNGYAFYEAYARYADSLLKPYGWIFLEVGSVQALRVIDLFKENGWQNMAILKDYAGIDRCVLAQRPHETHYDVD